MRASTLFSLTIAVLIGLGVAIAAKMSGYFDKPPEPPVVKKPEIMVLAAERNIFAGDMLEVGSVRVRTLRADETEKYIHNKQLYLPAVPKAVYLRVAKRNIEADEPILKDSLQEMVKPEPLATRLLTQMRAVNVAVSKERSAGGQIAVGEWVDVLLTTSVESNHASASTRTACIAPRVRVVAKRNTLWPIYAPLPEGKPVNFTLEVNPYRATVLEFSRNKGQLTLIPLPGVEQHKLETWRHRFLEQKSGVVPVHFMEPGSTDAVEEEARIQAFTKGELTVSDGDLARLFGLKTSAPFMVEQLVGLRRGEPAAFASSGSRLKVDNKNGGISENQATGQPTLEGTSFRFNNPESDLPAHKASSIK